MDDIQEIHVALSGEQIGAMDAAVEAGEYANTAEILREAVQEWQFKREGRQQDVQRLRRLWDEGVASGPGRPFDGERILAAARVRLSGGDRE